MKDATHFIHMYNRRDEFKSVGNETFYSGVLRVSAMAEIINHCEKLGAVQTIAIFKVKYKEQPLPF